MKFVAAPVADVWVVEPEPISDERGHFARLFDRDEFRDRGLAATLIQSSTSYNRHAGTLRGLHFQRHPHGEAKLVRCTRGSIWDVAADLRSTSASYLRWFGTVLSADDARMLYVPPGCAHGFVTLEDDSEVHYQIDGEYVPEAGAGVRWDDPALGIDWPRSPRVMSERDRSYPDLAT